MPLCSFCGTCTSCNPKFEGGFFGYGFWVELMTMGAKAAGRITILLCELCHGLTISLCILSIVKGTYIGQKVCEYQGVRKIRWEVVESYDVLLFFGNFRMGNRPRV